MNLGSSMAIAVGPLTAIDAGQGNEFHSLNLGIMGGAPDCSAVLESSPDGTTWTPLVTATGERWGNAATDAKSRYVRANVTSLGSGPSVSVLITGHPGVALAGGGPSGPPPDAIVSGPASSACDWAMTGVFYTGPVNGLVRGGAVDYTNSPVTVMNIPCSENPLAANNSGLLVVMTADPTANLTITDTVAGQNWNLSQPGGPAGCKLYPYTTWLKAHAATDVITITSDKATQAVCAVYQITEPGNGFTVPSVNTGHGTEAWLANQHMGGDGVAVIASPNGFPGYAVGFTDGTYIYGAVYPLYFNVSRGTPAP